MVKEMHLFYYSNTMLINVDTTVWNNVAPTYILYYINKYFETFQTTNIVKDLVNCSSNTI